MSDGPDFDAFVEWANRGRRAQQAVNDLGAGPPHVSRETNSPEEVLGAMRAKFGNKEADQYLRLAKALRALIHLWKRYVEAPEDSLAEAIIGQSLERMMDEVRGHPDHAAGLIEGLLALVQSMRMGGSFDDWFESIGLSPEPGRRDRI